MPAGSRVGVDGQVLGLAAFRALSAALAPAGIHLDILSDLLQAIWPDRPGLPSAPVYELPAPHACEPRADKLARVRAAMRAQGADAHWLSTLDDIAWLFNLRGSDVEYNPVFLAHALVGPDHATLFVAMARSTRRCARRWPPTGSRRPIMAGRRSAGFAAYRPDAC
ncbi:aminopeptidase [Bordetella pertussis]|nr:aminopeptidase [Bordetella pertussis]